MKYYDFHSSSNFHAAPNQNDCENDIRCTHLLSVCNSTRSLLTVATSKLVSDLWKPHRPNFNLAELITILVHRKHNLWREEEREEHEEEFGGRRNMKRNLEGGGTGGT